MNAHQQTQASLKQLIELDEKAKQLLEEQQQAFYQLISEDQSEQPVTPVDTVSSNYATSPVSDASQSIPHQDAPDDPSSTNQSIETPILSEPKPQDFPDFMPPAADATLDTSSVAIPEVSSDPELATLEPTQTEPASTEQSQPTEPATQPEQPADSTPEVQTDTSPTPELDATDTTTDATDQTPDTQARQDAILQQLAQLTPSADDTSNPASAPAQDTSDDELDTPLPSPEPDAQPSIEQASPAAMPSGQDPQPAS